MQQLGSEGLGWYVGCGCGRIALHRRVVGAEVFPGLLRGLASFAIGAMALRDERGLQAWGCCCCLGVAAQCSRELVNIPFAFGSGRAICLWLSEEKIKAAAEAVKNQTKAHTWLSKPKLS